MSTVKIRNIIGFLSLFVLFLIIGGYFFSTKLTFLETAYLTHSTNDVICVDKSDMVIEERFKMPFDVVESISVKIGNYQRDSNSVWNLELLTDAGEKVVSKEFGFYDAADNNYYKIDFGKKVHVRKNAFYRFRLCSVEVNNENKIGLYLGYEKNVHSEASNLLVDGELTPGILCMSINGGDKDVFWPVAFFVFFLVITFIIMRAYLLQKRGNLWYKDVIICSLLVGIIAFLLYMPFASTTVVGTFTDENDNIRGGMIIANGGVLYRDYVVQHPPIAYYVCAIYAFLGAHSVEQMRIMFYASLGIAWSLIYLRYYRNFGKQMMMALPTMVILCTKALIGDYSTMILSDNIQMMAMILLLLEFICYIKDRVLNIPRCIIVSLGVWISFGAAFLSAYSIFFFVVCFVALEVNNWKGKNCTVINCISRYLPLLIIGIIPLLIAIIYLQINEALNVAFQQMYLFNRMVYPIYQNIGGDIFAPFFSGLSAMFSQYMSSILAFGGGTSFSIYNLMTIVLLTGYMVNVLSMIVESKKILLYIFMTLIIASGATRGADNFHGQAFWGMLITWIVCNFDRRTGCSFNFAKCNRRINYLIASIGILLLFNPYINAITSNFSVKQGTVSYTDTLIVDNTISGEKIFLNAYANDSIYLLSKNRYPINRAVYCLPWYMDWYEQWDVEDLKKHTPNIVVWNPDQECWGRKNYMNDLDNYIKNNYEQMQEDATVWKKISS